MRVVPRVRTYRCVYVWCGEGRLWSAETRGGIVVEQGRVDDALQRTGLAALMYYPELQVDEPEYTVADDVEWCLEPLNGLPVEQLEPLRDVVARTIVDPTTHRARLFAVLRALVPDDE